MAKKKKCPECPAGERWAVPYADFLSLLLALFIALYAISSQNKDKLKALSKSFSEIFEFTPASTVPVSISQDPSQAGSQQATVSQKEDAKQSQSSREQQIESVRQLMKELQSVKDVAIENGNGSDTEVVMTEEGIRIRMLNAIIFEEGSAEMSQASNKMLDILANAVKSFPNDMKVEGYTASYEKLKPIYPSGWELSSARASSVVRGFISRGFKPSRFTAVGFADTRPSGKEEGAQKHFLNQRVDIVLMKYEGKGDVSGNKTVLDTPPPQTSIKH